VVKTNLIWGDDHSGFFRTRSEPFVSLTILQTKRRPLYLKTQSVPCCKHFSSRL